MRWDTNEQSLLSLDQHPAVGEVDHVEPSPVSAVPAGATVTAPFSALGTIPSQPQSVSRRRGSRAFQIRVRCPHLQQYTRSSAHLALSRSALLSRFAAFPLVSFKRNRAGVIWTFLAVRGRALSDPALWGAQCGIMLTAHRRGAAPSSEVA